MLFPRVSGANIENDQRITDLFVSRSDGEGLEWELRADLAIFEKGGEKALLQNIKLHYFIESGNDVHMSSSSAEVDFNTNKVFLKGEIRAESKEGIFLEADTLVWDGNLRSISTHERVLIKRDNIVVNGLGLEADLNLEKMKIKANAKTIIY